MSHHQNSRKYSDSSAGSYESSYQSSYQSSGGSRFSSFSTTSSSTAISEPDGHAVQYVPTTRGELPCEFVGYSQCDMMFEMDEVDDWIDHIITNHLGDNLPRKAVCWFCDDFPFDSKHTGDRRINFDNRMYHIRDHFYYEGKTTHDIRPDHYLNKHLLDCGLISEQSYNVVRRWPEAPQGPWIISYDATLPSRDPRAHLTYNDPHAEERHYRRSKHRSGKSRK
ncbi:hypothetical protein F5Y09DRAFT_69038 [Xylaria sp. FL1042]|nr:hypothetical protein F5Y09DRAFT_69038 [Xylaria sp. FL1042]